MCLFIHQSSTFMAEHSIDEPIRVWFFGLYYVPLAYQSIVVIASSNYHKQI